MNEREVLTQFAFAARIIEWRGPAPFLFAPIPDDLTGEIRFAARSASYGWGCVPVTAHIGATHFTTALIPRGGVFQLPIKTAVQRAEGIGLDALVNPVVTIFAPTV